MRAGTTPRQNIEAERERRGRNAVVTGCIRLLGGQAADAELIIALGWAVMIFSASVA